MIWDELTTEELRDFDKNTPVLLTITATEQHGPHLPLATDRIIGDFFARESSKEMGSRILVLPTIPIGCSDHHMDFAGTLTLSHDSFIHLIKDILDSVIHHGFKKIILLNSHGGNQAVGQVLIEQLGYRFPEVHFILLTWWKIAGERLKKLSEGGEGSTGHAGEFETSLLQFIAPELVREEKMLKKENKSIFPWAEGDMLNAARASYYRRMKDRTKWGTFGDPRLSNVEKGKKIVGIVLDELKQIVNDVYSIET